MCYKSAQSALGCELQMGLSVTWAKEVFTTGLKQNSYAKYDVKKMTDNPLVNATWVQYLLNCFSSLNASYIGLGFILLSMTCSYYGYVVKNFSRGPVSLVDYFDIWYGNTLEFG